jgi:hypothetical protein
MFMGSLAQAASSHDTSTGFVLVLPPRLLRGGGRAVTIAGGGHLEYLAMPLHSTNSITLEGVRSNRLRTTDSTMVAFCLPQVPPGILQATELQMQR